MVFPRLSEENVPERPFFSQSANGPEKMGDFFVRVSCEEERMHLDWEKGDRAVLWSWNVARNLLQVPIFFFFFLKGTCLYTFFKKLRTRSGWKICSNFVHEYKKKSEFLKWLLIICYIDYHIVSGTVFGLNFFQVLLYFVKWSLLLLYLESKLFKSSNVSQAMPKHSPVYIAQSQETFVLHFVLISLIDANHCQPDRWVSNNSKACSNQGNQGTKDDKVWGSCTWSVAQTI